MASVIEPSSSSSLPAAPRAEERLVDEQLRLTRRSLKFVDFASGLITLVIGVLAYLLCVSVLEHWVIPGGWGTSGRIMLFVTLLAGIAWYSWRTFWPLVSRSINPAYAAQLIEKNSPSLKNSLLNFLLLRNRRQQISQKVYQAIEQQAAQRLSEVSIDSVIDRSALVRLGYVLVAVIAVCVVYRVLSPKNLTTSIERVLLPWSDAVAPSRVEITNVTPGDTQIARGELLEVTAEVSGMRNGEQAKVRWSTLDGQLVDREAMLSASAGTSKFQGRLPDRLSGENGGVQQDLEYWIEAGDAKSPKYKVTVFARPTLVVEKIRYQFPTYTGLPAREAEGTGDIHALEGTKVTLYALANHEIANAQVDFNADGKHDLPMTADKTKATAQFTLALGEDRRTPEFDNYVLQYQTTTGRTSSLPPRYSIDVTPDYAPEIELLTPVDEDGKLVEQLDVPMDVPFTVEVEARDPDFALTNVVVLGEVGGEQVVRHDLLTKEQTGKFVGKMTATPEELGLKPGDVLEYWAAAVDNRESEPNTAQTDRLRIRVLGKPDLNNQGQDQGEQQQQGGGQGESGDQGGQGESGESGEGLAGDGEGQEGQPGEGQSGSAGQNGKGESQGEQQGQGGQGGGEGDQPQSQQSQGGGGQSGESGANESGAQQDGSNQNESQPNDSQQGDSQGNSSQQGGSKQQGQQGENGNQTAGTPQEGESGTEQKTSSEGDADAEAFEKMSQHFSEQDDQSQSEGAQGSEGNSETDQSESQGETQSKQGDGEGSPESDQSSQAEGGHNQDQAIDGSQEGEQSQGSGAEGQPNEQRQEQQADAEHKDEGEKQEAPGGKMSTEQGEQGAGNNPGENEGSMDTDSGRKSRDKSDKSPEAELNDQEAPGQSNSQQENDSKGSTGGDQAGGGQEGAGQQADAEGTGAAGENTAADDGAGQAAEQGAGENSSQAGQQGESDKPTGESSETKPGEGSKESDLPGGEKPGGEEQGEGGEPSGQPGEQQGEAGKEQGDQQGQPSQNNSPSTGTAGAQPQGDGTNHNNPEPPPPGELEPGDAANLDYARKQTDLVLDRLNEQLEKQQVDQDLLKKLGWTEEELRQFLARWKNLKAEAAQDEGKEQELDNTLKSLGLNNRRTGFQSNTVKEQLRQLQDSYRGQTPLEYEDQVRAYIKGTATAAEEAQD
jgi:hypothetical protein